MSDEEEAAFFAPTASTNRVLKDEELTLSNLVHMGGPKGSVGYKNWRRYVDKWARITESDKDYEHKRLKEALAAITKPV